MMLRPRRRIIRRGSQKRKRSPRVSRRLRALRQRRLAKRQPRRNKVKTRRPALVKSSRLKRPRKRIIWLPRYRNIYLPTYRWRTGGVLHSLSSEALDALSLLGMDTAYWQRRIEEASSKLIGFINRFHNTSGFDFVVRDYLAGGHRKKQAEMVIRLAWRLRDDVSLRFVRSRVFIGKKRIPTVDVVTKNKRLKLNFE